MTHDDGLAALLALDALEPDEQADAELHAGTFPAAYLTAVASLAESVTADPPADLAAAVQEHAHSRRPAGRPTAAASPCDPVEGFARTIADLRAQLDELSADEWELPAHGEHGTVRELMAHLVGIERLSARWLDPDDDVPPLLDHVASTRDVVASLADAGPDEIVPQWHEAARSVVRAARAGDRRRLVTFHDLTSTVAGFLVTRTFELWAHSMDISLATGHPLVSLDDERMASMSTRLMAALPHALAYRRRSAPGRSVRFVLTGAAGGSFTVPLHPGESPGTPDAVVVADAVGVCRVAARRLDPADLDATIEGDRDLAGLVLAGLDGFARD